MGFLIWLGLAVSVIVAGHKVPAKVQHTAEQKCHCTCDYIDGEWLWVQDDVKAMLQPGERIAKHTAFFRAGPLVCLAPGQPDPTARFVELQRGADDGYRRRVCESGRELVEWCP